MPAVIGLPPRYSPQLEVVGVGGFATVYRTVDLELDRPVAVKVPFRSENADLARETTAELKATAWLRHPNIVQLIDAGISTEGSPFLVMEYAEAGSFAAAMAALPPPWEQLLPLLDGVLAGLGHAHASGLVHRDVKPENVLLGKGADGGVRPMLSDFGLAKVSDRRGGYEETRLGAGTVAYMAPEQFEAETSAIHPGADLYSFGVMVYRLVTGRMPWSADSEIALLFAKLNTPPRPFVPCRGYAVPEGLDALLAQLMARRPADRPPLAADVRRELRGLGDPTVRFEELPTVVPGASVSTTFELPSTPAEWLPEAAPAPATVERFPPTPVLAAVREPLLVDRVEERRALWLAARRTAKGPVALALLGGSGTGRSCLCRWLLSSLEESGFARGLRVRLDEGASAAEALTRTLRGHLRLGRMEGDLLRDRIEEELADLGLASAERVQTLGDWLDPGAAREGAAPVVAGQIERRLGLLDQLLRAEARRGLVCLWVEERSHGARGSALVAWLCRAARAEPYPLLVLYEGASVPAPEFERIDLGPLAGDDLEALLGDLVPEGAAHSPADLVARCRGNAALALEWVRLDAMDLVMARGRSSELSLEIDVHARPPPRQEELPDQASVGRVAQAREANFVQAMGGMASERGAAAGLLTPILVLLPRPAPGLLLERVLAAACPACATDLLLDEARGAGLLLVDEQGWSFASPALAEGALLQLNERSDGARLRALCAEALLDTSGRSDPAASVHAGRLLLDAGAAERALEVLSAGTERLLVHDLDLARDAFALAIRAAEVLGLSADDPRRLAVILGASRAARNAGELDEVIELLSPIDLEGLSGSDRGWLLETLGSVRCLRGQLDEALAHAAEAREVLAAAGDLVGQARAAYLQGEVLLRKGCREEGRPCLEEALALSLQAGSAEDELNSLFGLGALHRAAGQREEARARFEEMLAKVHRIGAPRLEGMALRELGNLALFAGRQHDAERLLRKSADRLSGAGYRSEAVVTRISLGELHRARGRLREARKEYAAALSAARAFGLSSTAVVALFDLAVTELGMDRPGRAAKRLRDLDALLPPGAPSRYRPYVETLRLALHGASGDWDGAEDAVDWLDDHELPPDGDLVALLEGTAARAVLGDEASIAGDIYEIAADVAGRCRDRQAIDRIRESMAALGDVVG